jgi:GT2 family glycosyltransferase
VRIGVAILNWGEAESTIQCITRLLAGEEKPELVVVHDNASPRDSADRVASVIPSVHLLRSRTNIGFAAGMNTAVGHAFSRGMDGVWILNNDTLPDSSCLRILKHVLCAQSGTAAATGKIMNAGNPPTLQYAGATYDERLMRHAAVGNNEIDTGQHDRAADVPFVSGASMLVTREAWESVGPFFVPFFAYWEDADWSRRALYAGFRLYYDPRAVLTHAQYGGASGISAFRHYLYTRNHFYFIRRNATGGSRSRACLARAVGLHARAAVRLAVRGRISNAAHTLGGIGDGLLPIGSPQFFRVPTPP